MKTSHKVIESVPGSISSYRWVVLAVSFLAFVAYAFAFQLVPPLLKNIEASFGIDEAEAGLMMSMAVVPGIFLALPAGLIVNRFGFRYTGFASVLAVAAGSLVTAMADTFIVALLGRLILGIGSVFIIVGAPAIIPQWFSRKNLGKAMGIYGINMPLATVVAFPVAAGFIGDWHYPFYLGTVLAVTIAAVFFVALKTGPLKGDQAPIQTQEVSQALRQIEVWKAGFIWMCFNTAAIAYLSWAPTAFQIFKNFDPVYASLLASVFMYVTLVTVPFFGWISDRSKKRKPFMIVGSVAMGLTLLSTAIASDFSLILSVIALGISAGTVPPLAMTIVAENLPPRLSGTGFSIITLCQNVGIALSAPLGGYLLQTTNSLVWTFLGISLFAFASAAISSSIKSK